ncbi:MAG: hypothetical protein HC876_16720 [Chloroflexaceae bacterium]|nr:hypothetical protein [Chloroflexaceae bacterium]
MDKPQNIDTVPLIAHPGGGHHPQRHPRAHPHTYDQVGRLTRSVEGPGNTHGFRYDGAGNLLSQQVNGITTTVQTYNSAQEVVDWHYDAAGNRLGYAPGAPTYGYDALNRLTSAAGGGYSVQV